ncbi:band 4.1-like protein 3 [Clupea harengus]|uniref:Band 4.1-like protein 3 n=1 Tax=Clupea harengus TaxID=7950 RepID=A0A6P8GCR0_CLUHA|nr:band 4.1-like protein 3 [Clupea harengus]
MFPFSPSSSSTLSSMAPTLDTISELDILSDISEDDPFSWTGGEQPDGDEPSRPAAFSDRDPSPATVPTGPNASASPALLPPTPPSSLSSSSSSSSSSTSSSPGCECCVESPDGTPSDGEAQQHQQHQQPQPPRSSFSLLAACNGLRLPSLLDEDGYLCFPSLPEESLAAVLPAGLQRHLPLSSPSLVPSFLVIFAVLLSASQSLAFALLLALPLALALCYLEARASSRLLPPQAQCTQLGSPEELCDPAA